MLSDIENVRRLTELLRDEGFVDALSNAEELVEDVDERLERVEQIEGDAEQAVREANDALNAVDDRLRTFDEAIRLIEAKIEAGFSAGFLFFGYQQLTAGAVFIAAGLFFMGLLGSSSLVVTLRNMPQVERLGQMSRYLLRQLRESDPGEREAETGTGGNRSTGESSDERGDDPGPRIDWQTTADRDDGRTDSGRGGGGVDDRGEQTDSGRDSGGVDDRGEQTDSGRDGGGVDDR
jgi:hypothetical protein